MSSPLVPPVAEKVLFAHSYHDESVEDVYHWLRQEGWTQEKGVTNPKILDYLNAENAYAKQFFDQHQTLVQRYIEELKNVVDIDDVTYPISKGNGYAYFFKSFKGKDYIQHWRKDIKTGKEELLLDENELAIGHGYFSLSYCEHSPDHRYIAYAYDIDGSERMTLKIKDVEKNKVLPIDIANVSGNGFVWSNDSKGFYFQKVDDNWRSNRVFFTTLDCPNDHLLVFEEKDVINHVGISSTSDHEYLCINSKNPKDNIVYVQSLTSDKIDLQSPFGRTENILYNLNSRDNQWILLTNDVGPHRRLISVSKEHCNIESATVLYQDLPIDSYCIYKTHTAILTKKEGIPVLFIHDGENLKEIPFDEKSFTLDLRGNGYDDDYCHVALSSLTKPLTDILIDFKSLETKVVHQKVVPHYNADDYVTDRLWATSKDGCKIPYTIAYKKGLEKSNAPVYLYGYGSYGYSMDPDFRSTFIPLLNNGYIVVIAHIRGGSDLGRAWYEAAKLKTKKKTFEDFIACAEDLIEKGYTQKQKIAICGGSAGGMLMGAVLNMRPDLFGCAMAMVPFVDVINTMMDASLPLTPGEYHEWGNPQEKDFYDYMKEYSPYDNVEKKDYPPLYVTAGLNDPRVTYWEPAKWVAKLRDYKTDKHLLLFETEMGAGHGGPSGKLAYLEEVAKRYGFMDFCLK